MQRTRYIVSDLHIGAGDELDSFTADRSFKYLLEAASRRADSELIINGDFVDFISIDIGRETSHAFTRSGCTEEESLRKLERVIEAHPVVFSALKSFLGKKGHRLVLVPGNHDIDLFWPKVRDRLREVMGAYDDRCFYFEESGIYRDEGFYVEHGNQYFADTVYEKYAAPFLPDPKSGELRLERCWADCFHCYLVNGLLAKRNPFFNNVVPYYDLVFMCFEDEAWGPKMRYMWRLLRFLYKVGLPPLAAGRAVLIEKRMIGGEQDAYDPGRFLGLTSAIEEIDPVELVDAMQWEHGYPLPTDTESVEEMIIPLDILAARENTLMMAARDLLLSEDGIDIVAFGHEHQYFTNELRPEVSGRKNKYYVNTGTWIPMLFLNRARRALHWEDLRDKSLYQHLLTYAVVGGSVGDRVNLKCLAPIEG